MLDSELLTVGCFRDLLTLARVSYPQPRLIVDAIETVDLIELMNEVGDRLLELARNNQPAGVDAISWVRQLLDWYSDPLKNRKNIENLANSVKRLQS